MKTLGWGPSQWPALKALWQAESGWNPLAHNKSSGAHGIPQSLPASKMRSEGADYWTNPATQIRWGLKYIRSRYGSPAAAWSFWQRQSPHWYDQGGFLPRGLSLVMNDTGGSEPTAVFTREQWTTLGGLAQRGGGGEVHYHVNVTVQGAIDPIGTAKTIRKVLKELKRNFGDGDLGIG
ncbi:transglycosylase SLT domain-containing protein [Streptomyces sp. P17]|uniref:aggregation-promoting factor C-terminal-like domain-containing protein n=1 Tax=Streptomyces sp. P17 TaxID=3074716 RepID=UPI0028F43029|nr:transglycosylase SLT domain-containing protein [Streptomyces sp. P17]MDT9695364.1 transglycosylase SLT domain-containing protein [Streptomyces sp. P17]